jgi:hypothetical protein
MAIITLALNVARPQRVSTLASSPARMASFAAVRGALRVPVRLR